jgi:hypothetical protein
MQPVLSERNEEHYPDQKCTEQREIGHGSMEVQLRSFHGVPE